MNDWNQCKKENYGKDCFVNCGNGFVDFTPEGMKHVEKGEDLSYDDYLEIQHDSLDHTRRYFEWTYVDGDDADFKGKIEKRTATKIVFQRIMVNGMHHDGIGFIGKEDHVWMNQSDFEDFAPGDSVRFGAEIYRYLKTGSGQQIDYGLRDPFCIERIDSYEIPTDQELVDQQINDLVCEVCMYRDHCYMGNCIANEDERKQRFEFLRNLQPGKFTPLTVLAAFELEGRLFEQTGRFPKLDKQDPNYLVMKKIIDTAKKRPSYCTWPVEDMLAHMFMPEYPRIYIE